MDAKEASGTIFCTPFSKKTQSGSYPISKLCKPIAEPYSMIQATMSASPIFRAAQALLRSLFCCPTAKARRRRSSAAREPSGASSATGVFRLMGKPRLSSRESSWGSRRQRLRRQRRNRSRSSVCADADCLLAQVFQPVARAMQPIRLNKG